jgi:predicted MFS family arabinose efflux permease
MSLGAAVGLGFARFGYALLLPSMRASLAWTYAQAGAVNSANALGYLIGALTVGPTVAWFGAPRVIRWSLVCIALSLIASGVWPSFWPLMLARLVSGIGGALIFVAGMAVVLTLVTSRQSELPVGVYFAGPGIGIAVSGLLVPILLGPLAWDWRGAWVALGLVGFVGLALMEGPLRAASREGIGGAASSHRERLFVLSDYTRLWPTMTAYALFGLGYIGYMTFIVAYLQTIGVTPGVVQLFWVWLGVSAALSGFTWRPAIRRLGARWSLVVAMSALTIGAALPVLIPQGWAFALSAFLFGSSFLAIATTITLQVRVILPEPRWTTIMGNATALFALGQFAGPLLTGLVADMRGGLTVGLLGSAILLGFGAAIALIRPRG